MRVRSSLLATASVIALAVPVFGAVGASAGTDNPKACFGQDRAAGVATLRAAGVNWGSLASERAHNDGGQYPNDNVRQNKEYKATCS